MALGNTTAAAVTPALAPQVLAQRADHVPASAARKEDRNARTAARYQAGAADVQAFYRTNRYEN